VQRIALVKPDKARGVEDLLLNAAKRGQLGQKACGLGFMAIRSASERHISFSAPLEAIFSPQPLLRALEQHACLVLRVTLLKV
jgi:Double-stranded DNA-binding domain